MEVDTPSVLQAPPLAFEWALSGYSSSSDSEVDEPLAPASRVAARRALCARLRAQCRALARELRPKQRRWHAELVAAGLRPNPDEEEAGASAEHPEPGTKQVPAWRALPPTKMKHTGMMTL